MTSRLDLRRESRSHARRARARSAAWPVVYALALAGLVLVPSGCGTGEVSSGTLTPSGTSAPSGISAVSEPAMSTGANASTQALLTRALDWIEAEPTQVAFGPYTVDYARGAAMGRIQVDTNDGGEPIVPWPCWWTADGDYYYQPPDGPLYHVTTSMAEDMLIAGYPDAETGIVAVATINLFADPHRLLEEAQAMGDPQPGEDGTQALQATVHGDDLIGLSLPADLLARYTEGVRCDLQVSVALDGNIVAMTAEWAGATDARTTYDWIRTVEGPQLPGTWVDLDEATLEKALRAGWRASPGDAAVDVGFPVFWLGEGYQGLTPRLTHVNDDRTVLIEYGSDSSWGSRDESTTTTLGTAGYILFQYSEVDVPESEQPFLAEKTLIGEFGDGADAYSIYKTAKGQPGRSILVKRGETFISISATRSGDDVTEQLLLAAAALRPATSPGKR